MEEVIEETIYTISERDEFYSIFESAQFAGISDSQRKSSKTSDLPHK